MFSFFSRRSGGHGATDCGKGAPGVGWVGERAGDLNAVIAVGEGGGGSIHLQLPSTTPPTPNPFPPLPLPFPSPSSLV